MSSDRQRNRPLQQQPSAREETSGERRTSPFTAVDAVRRQRRQDSRAKPLSGGRFAALSDRDRIDSSGLCRGEIAYDNRHWHGTEAPLGFAFEGHINDARSTAC